MKLQRERRAMQMCRYLRALDPMQASANGPLQDRVDVAATALSSPMEKDSTSAYPTTMEIDAGQPSNQASTASSVLDYDPDDTMETQQTTATEVTDSVQSRVSQVNVTLNHHLHFDGTYAGSDAFLCNSTSKRCVSGFV